MEVFEVYNRSTNQWQSGGEIVAGWTENWVQDKTTDNMTLKTKYVGENAPNWKKGDWCRFIHLGENETGATYNTTTGSRVKKISATSLTIRTWQSGTDILNKPIYSFELSANDKNKYYLLDCVNFTFDGGTSGSGRRGSLRYPDYVDSKTLNIGDTPTNIVIDDEEIWVVSKQETFKTPKNHEQWVIKDVTLSYEEISGEWDCQLALQEPIEITNGISIETRSFTNQTSKVVDGITYTHEALNHLNVLETILKTTPANNDFNNSWFTRIGIIKNSKDILQNLTYNDDTLSEQTLYGLLLDKYDSSVGMTPVLYFDINPLSDLPNNLTRPEYVLEFLRQDGVGSYGTTYSNLINGCTDIVINRSGENFADGVISNFTNLAPNKNLTYPSETLWAIPEVDNNNRDLTNGYGSNSEVGVWILRTTHKIKKINKITKYAFHQSTSTDYWNKTVTEMNVLEKKQYIASDSTVFNTRNVDWYVEGENKIHLNDFYYHTSISQQADLIIYRVEYEPFINSRFDLGKDYNIQLNQNESQIDNEKFGKYLDNYIKSMNKSDIIVTKNYENFNDIYETGTRVSDGNKKYLITSVSIQNRDYDYTVTYQLNENHFRRNDSIVASQEIRENIEIAVDATKERKTMLAFNYRLQSTPITNEDVLGIRNLIFSSLLQFQNNVYPEVALLYFGDRNKVYHNWRMCDITKYYLNNTLCFNMTYFDNAEAGKKKTLDTRQYELQYITTPTGENVDLQGSPTNQIPVLYTDVFGEFQTLAITFIKLNLIDIENENFNTFTNAQDYIDYIRQVEKLGKYISSYPDLSNEFIEDYSDEISNPVVAVRNINYYKDMLDTFNYTIGFNIETSSDIILCKGFFEFNVLMKKRLEIPLKMLFFLRTMSASDDLERYKVYETIVETSIDSTGITFTQPTDTEIVSSVAIIEQESRMPILIVNNLQDIIGEEHFQSFKLYC